MSKCKGGKCKPQLLPSLLYTQGTTNVQQSEQDDLKVSDPDAEVAQAAIEQETQDETETTAN